MPSIEGAQILGIDATTVIELADHQGLRDQIRSEIKRLVSKEFGFKPFEYIYGVAILPKSFDVGDEMTNTFKIKRHVVEEKYSELISNLFD